MKIKIVTESTEAFAELNDTKTASAVSGDLPLSIAHRWGEEIYFDIPLELELEDGKEVLEIGDIAFWRLARVCASFSGLRHQAGAMRSGHTAP